MNKKWLFIAFHEHESPLFVVVSFSFFPFQADEKTIEFRFHCTKYSLSQKKFQWLSCRSNHHRKRSRTISSFS
ncbi:CLUMA_CG010134, isoform A [Clunio marinus]|uniref:CLUMA_CG010134, isoform A n=1 Tax=Clunio marinus TaxID=568069 RepID=A0A1J1IAS7_9DIPT|nr:CLUMA_CG010134, isoform A [Clunio marinus]